MNTKSKYRHLTGLACIIALAVCLSILGAPAPFCIGLVAVFQLFEFATSKGYRHGYICVSALTAEQIEEFEEILQQLKAKSEQFDELQKAHAKMEAQLSRLQKRGLGGGSGSGIRWVGNTPFVSDDAARALASDLVLDMEHVRGGSGGGTALEKFIGDRGRRDAFLAEARAFAGISQRAGGALSPTDIPLPTIYMPQVIELVFAYGQARQFGTVFPLGAGTVKLPRLQAGEDAFGFLGAGTAGMSQAVPQKEVTAQLVTFTANKAGGLIRIPTELEDDTFIALGQFLARYIARQLAKLEDSTMFLADSSGTYAGITGVGPYCTANPAYLLKPGAGNTVVTDLTVNNFRAMRGLVNPAVLSGMAQIGQPSAAYYMHPTLESLMVTFNVIGSPQIYIPQRGTQPATLDGFPIRWIGVSAANTGTAQPNAYVAFFGDLSYFYLGERGAPRVEISREVFFATDELAMRALERIDVEAMAIDAMSALQLPAA